MPSLPSVDPIPLPTHIWIFKYGYRSMRKLMDGRDRAGIRNFIVMLHDYKPDSPYRRFMAPMTGTTQDIEDLSDYLSTKVNPPVPAKAKPVLTAHR